MTMLVWGVGVNLDLPGGAVVCSSYAHGADLNTFKINEDVLPRNFTATSPAHAYISR